MSAIRLVVIAVLTASLAAASARGAEPARARTSLISVKDQSGRASTKRIRTSLEDALKGAGFEVVPADRFIDEARRQGLPKVERRDPHTIQGAGTALDLDIALVATLKRRGSTYRLVLDAFDPSTGGVWFQVVVRMGKATLTRAQAQEGAIALKASLAQARAGLVPRPAPLPPGPRKSPPPERLSGGAPPDGTGGTDGADGAGGADGAAGPDGAGGTDDGDVGATADASGTGGGDQRSGGGGGADGTTGGPTDGASGGAGDASADPSDSASASSSDWTFDTSGFDEVGEIVTPLAGVAVELGGNVRLEHFSYLDRLTDKVNARNAFDLALRAKATKANLLVAGNLLVRRDLSAPERNRLEAEEAYILFNLDPFELLAGRTLLTWGSMSLLNPTDILNPMDLREPLVPEKLGVWVARARLILGTFALEGYWLPVAEQNQYPFFDSLDDKGLPRSRSRWLEDDVSFKDADDVLLRVSLPAPELPEPGLDAWQGALRASGSLWGADFALAYGSLYDRMPVVHAALTPAPPFVDVEIQRQHKRLHFVAGEFEYALNEWHFAAEGLAVVTADPEAEDDEVPNPYFTVGAGVDYRSGELFHDHRLHLFADFFWTQALVGELREGELGDLRFPLGAAALGRVRYEAGQSLRFDLNVISSLERFDMVWNPQVEYLLGDNLSLQLGAAVLIGDEDAFFGRFGGNSMLTLQAEALF